jgi:hypothetical protein
MEQKKIPSIKKHQNRFKCMMTWKQATNIQTKMYKNYIIRCQIWSPIEKYSFCKKILKNEAARSILVWNMRNNDNNKNMNFVIIIILYDDTL